MSLTGDEGEPGTAGEGDEGELETAGELARVSGDFSHVRTRARFQVRRRLLALFAHPGARVATREAYHDGPALNKITSRYRPPTEQNNIALASPEQLTINNNLILNGRDKNITHIEHNKNTCSNNYVILVVIRYSLCDSSKRK